IWPMFAVGELINILQRGNTSLDRVNETMGYVADVTSPVNPISVSYPASIAFSNVSFSYPNTNINQLENITLHIASGQTIGVVGKTGAGKTTLFKLLLRQYAGFSGDIQIDDVSLEAIALDQIRSWVGYVPQDQMMFSKTIRENIQFGKGDATDQEIYRVMEHAHFLYYINKLLNCFRLYV